MKFRLENRTFLFKAIISLIGINLVFGISYYLSFSNAFAVRSANAEANYKQLLIIINLLFLLVEVLTNSQSKNEFKKYLLFLIGYFSVIVFLQGYEYSRIFHIYFLSLFFVFTFFLKFSNFVDLVETSIWKNAREHKVIIIGDEIDNSLIEYVNSRTGRYKCVAFLSNQDFADNPANKMFEGSIMHLEEILSAQSIDEVLISTSSLSVETIDHIMKVTEKYHAETSILPPYFQYLANQNYHTDYWLDVPVISVYHSKLSVISNRIVKRALDVCFSLIVLTVVFPVLCLVIAPAIWLSSRGPIFFTQRRKGYKQKPFHCYKFRTMKLGDIAEEVIQAQRQDPRVTTFGKTLRSTSIDEIPQFLNVLRGQMSIVGPRPHMVEHDVMYEKCIARYNVRFVTKPGITGWAQINGLRGSTTDSDLMEKRIEHDLWYIKNWSFWLDIKIILLTAIRLVKGDGNAY